MSVDQSNSETQPHEMTGAEKAAERKAAGRLSPHERAEAEQTREDRVAALIAGYRHSLAHNAPRTAAELAEIEALLGVEDAAQSGSDASAKA